MNRRPIRTLIYVLVAAQIFLSTPVVSAMAAASASASATAAMPCADSMPHAAGSDPCPCCPEGQMNIAACLSACSASVGAIYALQIPVVVFTATPMQSIPPPRLARASEPPLKPPPIA